MSSTTKIGYARLAELAPRRTLAPLTNARLASVDSIKRSDDGSMQVPHRLEPGPGALEQVLFALKQEGVDLAILSEVLPSIPPQVMARAFAASPSGAYVKKACYLWEKFTGQELEGLGAAGGAYEKVFDPKIYYTGDVSDRSSKWRVHFNGLGSLAYCPTLRRDVDLDEADDAVWEGLDRFTKEFGPKDAGKIPGGLFRPSQVQSVLSRTLHYAYLDETESSFKIESEEPSHDKRVRFVQALRQAHANHPLGEADLAELQRFIVTNPLAQEFEYRSQQNWLARSSRSGAPRVTYVPPPPEMVPELMEPLLDVVNRASGDLPAVARAAIASFGFVYIHPFMDGNGRISRFLAHQSLCQSGRLVDGMILPMSAAMLQHEDLYLSALEEFSAPVRDLWEVRVVDQERVDLEFKGSPAVYRYWDGGACTRFMLDMAKVALSDKLVGEATYIRSYDRCLEAINKKIDLPGKDVERLIRMCYSNDGVLSKGRRKQFLHIPADALDLVEKAVRREFSFAAPSESPPRAQLRTQ